MESTFDSKLWTEIWNCVKDKYDSENPKKPNHLHGDVHTLKPKLKEYCQKNVKLIAELPLLEANLMMTLSHQLYKIHIQIPRDQLQM